MTNIQKLFPLIALAALCSCSSRHIQRSDTSLDSTVIKENRMLKEALEASGQTIERLVRDSSGQSVTFGDPIPMTKADMDVVKHKDHEGHIDPYPDSLKGPIIWSTDGKYPNMVPDYLGYPNTVTFKDGKIVQASGNIKSATASMNHALNERDSAYTLLLITQDSLHTEQANKKVEIRTVEKRVGWPWYIWLLIGAGVASVLWNLKRLKRFIGLAVLLGTAFSSNGQPSRNIHFDSSYIMTPDSIFSVKVIPVVTKLPKGRTGQVAIFGDTVYVFYSRRWNAINHTRNYKL